MYMTLLFIMKTYSDLYWTRFFSWGNNKLKGYKRHAIKNMLELKVQYINWTNELILNKMNKTGKNHHKMMLKRLRTTLVIVLIAYGGYGNAVSGRERQCCGYSMRSPSSSLCNNQTGCIIMSPNENDNIFDILNNNI